MQRPLLIALVALAPSACLPAPKDAGQAESVGADTDPDPTTGNFTAGSSTSPDDGASETGPAPEDPGTDVEWSLELDATGSIFRMIRSPDGVVAVLQANDPLAPSAELFEVTADMDVAWSKPLPDSWVADLDPVGGGGYLLAGQKVMAGMPVATAWRMSCCDDFEITSSPLQNDVPAAFMVAELLDDGILLAIEDDSDVASFIRITFELSVYEPIGSLPLQVLGGARTPSGDVALRGSEGGDVYVLYEMASDGSGSAVGSSELTMLVGEDDGLALMTFGNEQLFIQPYEGGAILPVAVPGLSLASFAADRRERFAFAFSHEAPDGSATVHVSEFDETGAVLREIVIPGVHGDAAPTAVVVGEDDAIYVAVREDDLGGGAATILHRIAPLPL